MNRLFFCLMLLFPLLVTAKRPSAVSLAGQWRFAIDSTDIGESEHWFDQVLTNTISLPGITDEGGYGDEVVEKGKLSRLHKYVGKAWYQLDITVPKDWKNKSVDLFLERVMWRSKLWVDGKAVAIQESLATPHTYSLGKLSPGVHTLTLSVDNREIYPIGNLWSHSYGDQTQIIWNGVLGRMELNARPDIQLKQIRTFADATGNLNVEIALRNSSLKKQKAALSLVVKDKKTGRIVQSAVYTLQVAESGECITKSLKVDDPNLWDEFSPNLYVLECSLKSKFGEDIYRPISFGFRTLGKTADFITLNGTPRFLRGNLDCALFPLTGYSPTDKESWLRIFKIYKDYGLNHVRFHSWTPPEAAFEAADEVGLYVLSEIFWRDGWMGKGLNVDSVAPFLRPELMKIADVYGDHPSFIMQAMGNELGGFDRNRMDSWIAEVKEHDPRRFYTVSIRRPPTAHADINIQGDLSSPYPLLFIDEGRLSTDWDYGKWYGEASPLPSIQHEVGQWVFYPDWKETEKYTGNLRARGLEHYKQLAKQRGICVQNKEFVKSSGMQSLTLYKENIESLLRTPLCGGFQLLGMQDFSGQGEALVGWLDAFYDSKGIVTPERFRNWCNTTVPLMRSPSYVYTNRDTLQVGIEVLRFDMTDLEQSEVLWNLVDESGSIIGRGSFGHYDIRNATLNKVGQIRVPLNGISSAKQLKLTASIQGTSFKNDWNFWVYPEKEIVSLPSFGIMETFNLQEAINGLKEGKTVLLWAHDLGSDKNIGYAQWKPTFWQGGDWKNEGCVNGALIRNLHPALAGFPTDSYLDFQWFDICKGARGFDLEGLPELCRPIVQPIHDFHFNRKLATVIELCSEEGGKILICGYNLTEHLDTRPAALALRNSLVRYVSSSAFHPTEQVSYNWLRGELQSTKGPYLPPSEFEQAFLYVKAGAKCSGDGLYAWSSEKDGVSSYEADKYGYDILCENILMKDRLAAWQGDRIQLDFKMPFQYAGKIRIHVSNPEKTSNPVTVLFNGQETFYDHIPEMGEWVTLQMKPGEALLGKISVVLRSSGKCTVDEIALIK